MEVIDLAVVGAGPAGSSAAITAARAGMKVVLFEARRSPRHKVCGEFVSAEALQLLTELLRDVPIARGVLRAAPLIARTRFLLGERSLEAPVSPAGLSISRYQLDALLWDAAIRAGVEASDECEVVSPSGTGPFTLQTSSGTRNAIAVIVAAGRWSQFSRDRTVPAGPKWIGLKAHFYEQTPARSTDLYFFGNGYCGVQPVSENRVNACAIVRSDKATSLPGVFRLHPMLARRTSKWKLLMQPVTTAPLVYRDPEPVRGEMLFAGDAACFIDPFVGDGISIALRSGVTAATCVQQFWEKTCTLTEAAACYEREYRQQFAALFSRASRLRALLSLPKPAQVAAFHLLRLPGVMPLFIRKTRQAA